MAVDTSHSAAEVAKFAGKLDIGYVKETLDSIEHLTEVESLNDPENEPFRSKYAARTLLEELKKVFSKLQDDYGIPNPSGELHSGSDVINLENIDVDLSLSILENLSVSQRIDLFLRFIEGKLGVNYIDCEETSSGEEHLNTAVKGLEEHYGPCHPAAVYMIMHYSNQIGILQASRRHTEKASNVFCKVEELYKTYKQANSGGPLLPSDLLAFQNGPFEPKEESERWKAFEAEYTQTLYYLAQVHQKSSEDEKAVEYIQLTLKRQLELKQDYKPARWALDAATLSQYYLTKNNFTLSRHCLASAMKILEEEGPIEVDQEEDSLYGKLVSIKRCWIKYGLGLLEESWSRLERDSEEASPGQSEELKLLFDLELTLYEDWITDQYILDFDQARKVFLKVQEFIKEAQMLFTVDEYCSDYIELVQDHSRLYKCLIKFEPKPDRRSKMHKRRVDMLEDLTEQLSQQHYLLVWRQLVYELAETYSDMAGCKKEIQDIVNENATIASRKKLNKLCEKSIKKFKLYISSLKTTSNVLPDVLPPGDERPALLAWFHIARLYYKMNNNDPREKIEHYQKAHAYYQRVVDMCDRRPEYAKAMENELPACREFSMLLPVKMRKMQARYRMESMK